MRTYDTKAGTHGTAPFWKSLKALLLRWLDREREIVSLRNAVGMMSEARRADAAEYHQMVDLNRGMREDARRYQLLRRGQHWSVINGVGDQLRAEALDAAIDAQR